MSAARHLELEIALSYTCETLLISFCCFSDYSCSERFLPVCIDVCCLQHRDYYIDWQQLDSTYRKHVTLCFSSDNRRLDEWITLDRFESLKKIIDTSRSDALRSSMEPVDGPDRKITRNQKRKHDEINHVQRVHTPERDRYYYFKIIINSCSCSR